MTWFLTEYRSNWAPIGKHEESCRPGNFSMDLWAGSISQARRLAKRRGMGERVVSAHASSRPPYLRASDWVKRGSRKRDDRVLHSLVFLGQLALASGVATIQEVLGDEGIIHEYFHRTPRSVLIEKVRAIEDRVPGYWPVKKIARS